MTRCTGTRTSFAWWRWRSVTASLTSTGLSAVMYTWITSKMVGSTIIWVVLRLLDQLLLHLFFFFVFTWILSSSGSVCFEARHRQRFDRTNRQRSGTLRAETQLLHASQGTQRQRARIALHAETRRRHDGEMRTRWMDAPPEYPTLANSCFLNISSAWR